MKVLVAGGGSGGHIAPVLAVIEALKEKEPSLDVLYVGSRTGIENKIIPRMEIPFKTINAGKLRRYHKSKIVNILNPKTFVSNALDLAKAVKGVTEAMKIIKWFDPNTIFIKGGYVGLPVGIAARILGYPFVIHESDTIPGLSNRILSKWAKYTLVSYPEKYFKEVFKDAEKVFYTGNPVRSDLTKGEEERGYQNFSLKKEIPTILFIGGSQGARAINDALAEELEDLLNDYQIIHITGELDYDRVEYRASKLPKDLSGKYRFYDFLSADLKDAYKISSLVVSRAGNNVLTELAALGKPSILIPLPSSANDHQYNNALVFSRAGASYLMTEDRFDAKGLRNQINYLFQNKEELTYMKEKVKDLYKKDAAKLIAEKVMEIKIDKKKEKAKKKGGNEKLVQKKSKDKE